MARRVTPSQLKSIIRQQQQKQRQAINKYNQAVRQHNQKVKHAVDDYNREVRAHNARVRANRQRLKNELARLSRQKVTVTTRYVVYQTSTETLVRTYDQLERRAEQNQYDPRFNRVLDLSERETANSLSVTNTLLTDTPDLDEERDDLRDAELADQLREISPDLDNRWRGAVFSLDPRNPDAARHFCTSAREIFTQILEIKAPDNDVFSHFPDCDKTERGNATRRSKIRYILYRKGMADDTLENFVEEDIENVLQLFHVFNDGTHGSAGKFGLQQLERIKKRVEDGIVFLAEVCAHV